MKNSILKWTSLGCITLGIVLVPHVCRAQDYIGAGGVLRQVEERNAKPAEKPVKPSEAAQLRQDLKAFVETETNLPPAEAAKRWLELVDRTAKVQASPQDRYSSGDEADGSVLDALPPPETWSDLAKAIAARPTPKKGAEVHEIGLRLLAATLTGDAEACKAVIAGLQAQAKNANVQMAYFYRGLLSQLSEAMLMDSDDPDIILKGMERQLAQADDRNGNSIQVPNLVSEVGPEKARAFLRKALITPNAMLEFQQPNETSRLAQSLALELMDQLKSPQWGLVNSLDSVKLYEALDKRFGAETNSAPSIPGLPDLAPPVNDFQGQMQKGAAQIYYMLGLISQDRAKDAVVIAKKISGQQNYYFEGAFKVMEQAGYTAALDSFFYELLSQDPTLSFWDQYVDLAAKAGQTGRMLALVQTNLAPPDLSDERKASLHQILFKAELAADKLDDGVEEMRRLMALDLHPAAGRGEYYSPGQLGGILARIGILTQKPEWTEEGIAAAKKWLTTQWAGSDENSDAGSVRQSLAEMLIELNRGPEAESLLTDALADAVRNGKKQNNFSYGGNPGQAALVDLAALYHQAGRRGDVLALLERSPNWDAKDLSELFQATAWESQFDVMGLHTGSSPLPVSYLAADALLADGQKERARKIIYELLNQYPGLDRGYELLLALDDTNAIPKLDELFARDQFEERPLIWKGHLLQEEGRLEEAEKVIRQAVSIDPSDGEEGRGDRMRVYAELAEIRDARGDKKEADFYREVVKAIRLSENADQFYKAG
ncbi:MAG TPA: hypothetical protein VH251_09855, partial [Verrucomicrobiae bacterium]|nr:hypothetical protein [Verrucomicrobiae bacterium]